MRPISLLVVAVTALTGVRAYAQDFHASPYSENVYNEGPGFRIGAGLVLHPGLAVDAGYDSNVFYLPSGESVGSGLLRIRAHLDLATLPPQVFDTQGGSDVQKLEFRFSALAEYREYLTTIQAVRDQRSVNIFTGAHLSILPRGPFTLTIDDYYIRTVDPRNYETTNNFTRDNNTASVVASYHTPGDALEVGLGDTFYLNLYESGPNFGNSYRDEGQVFAKWRFLPRSILSLLVRVGYNDYVNDTAVNGIPLRAVAGFSSLFSTWFGLSVTAGYGNSFSSTGPSYNNFIGGADFRFMLPYHELLSLQYDRDFYDSLFANYFVDDHIGLYYTLPFTAHLAAHFEGGVRFRHYDGLAPLTVTGYTGYSTPTRDDILYTVRAELDARATSWLVFAASYDMLIDDTKFAFISGSQMSNVSYVKHSVFGRIDVAY